MSSVIDGRYQVEERIGRGGMGAVYRVLDTSTGSHVALKRLDLKEDRGRRRSENAELRFRREFHTMASLAHPRIVEVYDYGRDSAGPYYTMELIEGHDLIDSARSDVEDICRWLRDVASALSFLHARRLVHRDIAPRNVRCTPDGRAKLLDFGVLATMGLAAEVAGTPPFISPESVRGLPLDHRADIFGLGALAYFLLTGRHAYPARGLLELENAWSTRPTSVMELRDDVAEPLDHLVLSMVSLDPLGRPSSAAEVADRLGGIAGLAGDTEREAQRGWLISASLVGRQAEMGAVRDAIASGGSGSGAALVFEAPSGMGKSRLLREAGLEAQLAGGILVRSASEGVGSAPYGHLRQLVSELFRV